MNKIVKKKIKVSASILCADFARLGEEIKACADAGVDMLHVDVMDGHFVPNITIGPVIVRAIRPLTDLPIETHLMIEDPGRYIKDFAEAGADIISVHAECYGERRPACREYGQFPKEIDKLDADAARADLRRIRELGKKAFLVINPGTPMCAREVRDELDGVLVMSVNPGFARQKFMPQVLEKVRDFRQGFDRDIAVDGGVNGETAAEVVGAGANVLATASYLFGAPDRSEAVKYLKNLL